MVDSSPVGTKPPDGLWQPETHDWITPPSLLEPLDREFGFDEDVTPLGGVEAFFREWRGSIYVNPPYGPQIERWLRKGLNEIAKGHADVVVMLLPVRADTRWFHDLVLRYASEIRLIKGRLMFSGRTSSAPFASMVAVFRQGGGRVPPVVGSIDREGNRLGKWHGDDDGDL